MSQQPPPTGATSAPQDASRRRSAFSLTRAIQLPGQQPRRRSRHTGVPWLAVIWLSVLVLAAITADWIPGLPSYEEKIGGFAQPPDLSLGGILGTDGVGRSNLSRIIYGARISLTIAVVSTMIGLTIGVVVGMLGGYYRRAAESVSNVIANTLSALPPLLLLLALVSAMGATLPTITIALGIVISDLYIRMTKGAVISAISREYILAARALGARDLRLMVREVMPNLIPVLGSVVPMAMAIMIIVEGSLSFLGFGIPAPTPSWGGMIAAGADIMRTQPVVILGPVITLFLTVFSFNSLGDYLASRADGREGKL